MGGGSHTKVWGKVYQAMYRAHVKLCVQSKGDYPTIRKRPLWLGSVGRVEGRETRDVSRGQSRRAVMQTMVCYGRSLKSLERFEQGWVVVLFML